ncbi:hypothetical protein [Pinibacter soli]|uniref:Uncharacterized protein n=1 Tax=Pinibacter soli TaxID=3044211 RepID=A0ABT6RBF5_9BACT|nr:hypothetical protein [Pinibacter soli]MDI3319864.1 hypothetical protein [Pinibacter soli]
METKPIMFRKDNIKLGLILGAIAPLAAMYIYYAIMLSKQINLSEYFYYLKTNKSLLTGVSSISLIANAIFFTVYVNTQKDKTAKGIFISTLIYGIAVLLIKLVR